MTPKMTYIFSPANDVHTTVTLATAHPANTVDIVKAIVDNLTRLGVTVNRNTVTVYPGKPYMQFTYNQFNINIFMLKQGIFAHQ